MNGRILWPLGLAALLGVALAAMAPAAAPPSPVKADAAHPVVVELFQSQGCSSCPPANANLNAIAGRPDVLALSFSITYWDYLGWKDTFAQKAFTDRQKTYAAGPLGSQVATPEMVVNGRFDLVGQDQAEVEASLRRAGAPGGPAVRVEPGRVSIAAGPAPGRAADVWLVRYDPRVQNVPIARGENEGRTLPHRNIVRQLVRLGGWNGAAASFILTPPRDPAWRTAVLVQAPGGGPILGAGRR
ncbi:hypothetical protein QO010_003629 [Caulobacter ginsengisoli]|uniref:DUF1223 domain-containing protein n=1 Tax=Caulobacter ginsengisoli TaxID=400775 RepID=A0ABU0IV04_9CAUL|nr:DUF1223 domain-containing protein [Caulobacter ginsengisoli]MDQ0465837.1 hypothetical protein [Caulobacter ginsengisoli]